MKSAGSVLLEHWQAIHGDPVKMLYYAQEANKVLTAKVKTIVKDNRILKLYFFEYLSTKGYVMAFIQKT